MRECPCGECEKQGCGNQDRCSRYILWKTIREEMREHRREKSAAWNGVTEYNQARYNRRMRKQRWRGW